jgi:hypothetical protein
MYRFSRLPIAAFAVLAVVSTTGCGDDNNNPIAATPTARVMAVHASPDAPAVDLVVDGAVAGTGLTFPNNTGYLTVNAGTRNVKVNVSSNGATVINADLPTAAGGNYSVFATGPVAGLEALVVPDDLTAPAAGKAHVRFIHLSPDAPAVDVAVTGGPVLFPNQSFRDYTAFTPVDAGSYDLEVRPAGMSSVVLALPGVTLEAGRIYTVFAKGFLNGTGPQALGAQTIVNN